jgi:hypothetical protein
MAKHIRVNLETTFGWYDEMAGDYVYRPDGPRTSLSNEYSVPDQWVQAGMLTQEGEDAVFARTFGMEHVKTYQPSRIVILSFNVEVLGDTPESEAEAFRAEIQRMQEDWERSQHEQPNL